METASHGVPHNVWKPVRLPARWYSCSRSYAESTDAMPGVEVQRGQRELDGAGGAHINRWCSTTITLAGCRGGDRPVAGGAREACDTAGFPRGGRVGHGRAGWEVASEADGREHAGGGRDEREDSAEVEERGLAVIGGCAADVADTAGCTTSPDHGLNGPENRRCRRCGESEV